MTLSGKLVLTCQPLHGASLNNKSFFGYKNHVNADAKHKLIPWTPTS